MGKKSNIIKHGGLRINPKKVTTVRLEQTWSGLFVLHARFDGCDKEVRLTASQFYSGIYKLFKKITKGM